MKLSVIVLAYNEEKMIRACLESAKWADEVVIINSASKDKTLEIASQYTKKIFERKLKSFAEQRDFGAKEAEGEWILYLDADERITKNLQMEIKKALKTKPFSAYQIPRQNYFYGKKIRYGGYWPDYVTRLFKKNDFLGWQGKIHESPKFKGKLGTLQHPMLHLSHRSVSEGFEKSLRWTKMEAELFFKANHPKISALRVLKVGLWEFCYRYFKKLGFLDGFVGFVEAMIQAWNKFMVYTYLWELQNQETINKNYQKVERELLS